MDHRHKHHDKEDDHDFVRRPLAPPSSDMNVTPLIDVLLVLLVIFMATLPLNQKGMDINLPLEVSHTSAPKTDVGQVVAEYSADHQLSINHQPTAMDGLESRLHDIFASRTEKTLFVIGDRKVRYGEIMPIIDAAIGAGAKVAIVTEGMKAEAAR
jgi:biopolymer transport protein TolR